MYFLHHHTIINRLFDILRLQGANEGPDSTDEKLYSVLRMLAFSVVVVVVFGAGDLSLTLYYIEKTLIHRNG